jgi:hypothetical protein
LRFARWTPVSSQTTRQRVGFAKRKAPQRAEPLSLPCREDLFVLLARLVVLAALLSALTGLLRLLLAWLLVLLTALLPALAALLILLAALVLVILILISHLYAPWVIAPQPKATVELRQRSTASVC